VYHPLTNMEALQYFTIRKSCNTINLLNVVINSNVISEVLTMVFRFWISGIRCDEFWWTEY
jgi:hypothetical protein